MTRRSRRTPQAAVPFGTPVPQPRRRLSALRIFVSLVLVGLLSSGGYTGWQVWSTAQAVVDTDPWFAAYVDVTATPTFAFESPASPKARDLVLSFIVADPEEPCTPTWGTAYSLDAAADTLDLDRRLARVAQAGGQVIVSFGGLLNTELSTGCTKPSELVAAYAEVLDRYEVSTIDLDIEGENLTDVAAGERRATALATLQQQRRSSGDDLAVWLTLPVAPSGLTGDGTSAVAQMLAAGVDLAGVNAMTMDYGSSRSDGDSMAEASVKALTATHRQLSTLYARAGIDLTAGSVWAKIGATPMIGQNDVPGEIFSLKDARALNEFVRDKGLGRMSMWSLNRDLTCGANYVDLVRVSDSCSGIDQGELKFADLLGTGLAGRPDLAATLVTKSETGQLPSLTDNAATSPYAIWDETSSYLAGTKIVWHRSVYQAKWWTRGDLPDNPVLNDWETPWTLLGPVLPGETPLPPVTVPAGTYPDWSGEAVFEKGARVVFDGTPFEAKWWTQGDSPEAASATAESSPWAALTQTDVQKLQSGSTK